MAKQHQKQRNTIKTIKTRKQKNKKNTKQKQKMTRPNSLPLLPPLGCAVLFFFGGALGFLVSYFLVRCWFFLQWLTRPKTKKTRNQNNTKPKKNTKKQNYIYIHHIIYDLF
jgi:hypothetical protein